MSAEEGLFRREALDFQQQQLHGSIVLTNGTPGLLMTLLLCLLALTAVVFFCIAGITRKETVPGVVMPIGGLARITAPQAGTVVERRVQEGHQVAAGEVLLVLSSERSTQYGDTQQSVNSSLTQRIERLEAELHQQQQQTRERAQLLQGNVQTYTQLVRQLDEEITLQQRRSGLTEATAKRYETMSERGLISETEVQERQAEALEQRVRLHALQRQRLETLRSQDEQRADRSDLPLRSDRESSQLERTIEALRQELAENEAKRRVLVRAPQAGRVSGLSIEPGQSVLPGQLLLQLEPADGQLEAELFVSTRAIGFVQPGDAVLLRYAAFPFQKFGQYRGTVRAVGRSALLPSEFKGTLADEHSLGRDPVYRLRIKLEQQQVAAYGAHHDLKPGMQLQASLMLEHRKLYEWLLEPLWTLGGRL